MKKEEIIKGVYLVLPVIVGVLIANYITTKIAERKFTADEE